MTMVPSAMDQSSFPDFTFHVHWKQCDQKARFLQVLGNKLSHIFVTFCAISNNVTNL